VYCASVENIYALDADIGKLKWHVGLEAGHPVDTVCIYEDSIFVSVEYHGMYSLDVQTGKVQWKYKTEYGPFTAPCVSETDGIVYVASGPLHAVSITNGKAIWTSEKYGLATSAPIVVGDYIYIGGGRHRFIHAFNRHTGEKVWEYPTGDLVYSTPAYANGRLVIGCHDGYVYCFENDNTDN
jgi:outer membrane protein assembly factor BamB